MLPSRTVTVAGAGRLAASHVEEAVRVLPIRGRFDPAAAAAVAAAIAALPEDSHVVLDFSAAREIPLLALCILANAITAAAGLHVVQRGLPRHEERVLQYLGIAALRATPDHDDP